MNLHPPAFVETAGGCEGPRYIRSQPSRETAGVLLNECEAKYIPNFELPYRNISRYISELGASWDKLNSADKSMIKEDLKRRLPGLDDTQVMADVLQDTVQDIPGFIKNYVSVDPAKNTMELLDSIYTPSQSIVSAITEGKAKEIHDAVDKWATDQPIMFHANHKTIIVFVVSIVLAFFIGIFLKKIKP